MMATISSRLTVDQGLEKRLQMTEVTKELALPVACLKDPQMSKDSSRVMKGGGWELKWTSPVAEACSCLSTPDERLEDPHPLKELE